MCIDIMHIIISARVGNGPTLGTVFRLWRYAQRFHSREAGASAYTHTGNRRDDFYGQKRYNKTYP